jgi:hypothetical protein
VVGETAYLSAKFRLGETDGHKDDAMVSKERKGRQSGSPDQSRREGNTQSAIELMPKKREKTHSCPPCCDPAEVTIPETGEIKRLIQREAGGARNEKGFCSSHQQTSQRMRLFARREEEKEKEGRKEGRKENKSKLCRSADSRGLRAHP